VKRALISDIHGNIEALRAVLADIRQQDVTDVYCLGDIVGYGPNPCECLDAVMQNCRVTILGNHDQAALFDPEGFNPVALQAIYWTRDQLEKQANSAPAGNDRWTFLGELPRQQQEGDILFVHGSPREPTNEYVFPEDVYNQRKMDALFDRFERVCFQGHTHIPGVFTASREFVTPEECEYRFRIGADKLMVNVGSVGQPRDNDPRACYVIVNDELITYRRVDYAVEETIRKIYGVLQLDNMLGDRLRSGR
jgi:diadenosine tetraphosphatase ApaH/serine/threonine PP2A family protein phosphatase